MPLKGLGFGTPDSAKESVLDAVKRRLTKTKSPAASVPLDEEKTKDFVKSFKDSLGG